MVDSAIAAKVDCVNNANRIALMEWDRAIEIFRPLVGCKVTRKDHSLLRSVSDSLFDIKQEWHTHKDSRILLLTNEYNIRIDVTFYVSYNEISHSHGISVYIGDLRDQVLTCLYDRPALRTDFSADDIVDAFRRAEALHAIIREITSRYHSFYDIMQWRGV